MAYRIAAIPMTLSGLRVNCALRAFSNGIYRTQLSLAAVDNISSDIARRALPLR